MRPTPARLTTLRLAAIGCSAAAFLCQRPTVRGADETPPAVPLAIDRVVSLPGPAVGTGLFVKPGHWTSIAVEARAAQVDFRGELQTRWTDTDGRPWPAAPAEDRVRYRRDAVLPRDETRALELCVYSPPDDARRAVPRRDTPPQPDERRARMELREFTGTRHVDAQPATTTLRRHQSLFVVVADRPERYQFLDGFDALQAPHDPRSLPEHDAHFRVVFAADTTRALLPSCAMAWTTTSYVLWDGYDADRLQPAQLAALLDWLHWGGTLIVAGPGTLDTAKLAALASWLPVRSLGTRELDAPALAPLTATSLDEPPASDRNWPGVRLEPLPESHTLLGTPDAPLVVERRLGRGRIVVTAFPLDQRELIQWSSYPSLFQAYLLRRPPRYWRPHPDFAEFASVVWNDRRTLPNRAELEAGIDDPWFDAARSPGVRSVVRDDDLSRERRLLETGPAVGSGRAAWRDDGPLGKVMRTVLREAAGIEVPPASLVIRLLVLYIVVVVPINWLVFRSLRRTEWAWAAMPVLAVVFSFVVARAARLDLGFVRSEAETAVVEMQPGHDRAWVSRRFALYNSLGTTYDLGDEERATAVLPAATSEPDDRSTTTGRDVEIFSAAGPETGAMLKGFVVDSNSVGAVRTEQFLPTGGTIAVEQLADDRLRIVNGTSWELRDVRIVGRITAAVDVLPARASSETTPSMPGSALATTADEALRSHFEQLDDDELLRLTAWTPTPLSTVVVRPTFTQHRVQTLIVAHLEYADAPPPTMDANTRASVVRRITPAERAR